MAAKRRTSRAGFQRSVVTIGVFDGVHRAHQHVIRTAIRLAHRLRATSIIITFDPDPHVILQPASAPPALMPLEARLDALRALGPDRIVVMPFTKRFAAITAEQFVREQLIKRLRTVAVVVGEDFAFGKNRHGDQELLRALGDAHRIRVVCVPSMRQDGGPISSSRIRRLISLGHLAKATRLLGRPTALYGTVVSGQGRGRQLGVPTANLALMPHVLPPRGVYAVTVQEMTSRRRWRGVMNLGVRPTFGPGPQVCEVHLFGFSGHLAHHSLIVSLHARLRGERRFATPEALRRQMQRDITRTHRIFSETSSQ